MNVLPHPGGPVDQQAAAKRLAVQLLELWVADRREHGRLEPCLHFLHAANVDQRQPSGLDVVCVGVGRIVIGEHRRHGVEFGIEPPQDLDVRWGT